MYKIIIKILVCKCQGFNDDDFIFVKLVNDIILFIL